MNRISRIILLFIGFSLVLPTGVFASPVSSKSTPQPALSASAQLVKVVTIAPTQTVSVAARATSGQTSCAAAVQKDDLVQDAGAINFNQPSSCFSLVPARPAAAAAELSVVPLRQAVKIVVENHLNISEIPSLTPPPLSRSNALPAIGFAAIGALAVEYKKYFRKSSVAVQAVIKSTLTVYQLQIMRC